MLNLDSTVITDKEIQRFFAKIKISTVRSYNKTPCHEWIGSKLAVGYGQFKLRGRVIRSHRFVWFLNHGAIPENMCVLHHCDNPSCCNQSHLFLGTNLDNTRDMCEKGRHNCGRGEQHGRVKLKDAQIPEIFALRAAGFLLREIAARMNVGQTQIRRILNGTQRAIAK